MYSNFALRRLFERRCELYASMDTACAREHFYIVQESVKQNKPKPVHCFNTLCKSSYDHCVEYAIIYYDIKKNKSFAHYKNDKTQILC